MTPANLCKPIHDIINYPTSIHTFVSRKCGREEEKLQKIEYLENENSFLDEIKNIFHFSFGEKIKISKKIADTSFKFFLTVLPSIKFQIFLNYDF